MAALVGREAPENGVSICVSCSKEHMALWRCRDCSIPKMLCRACMRVSHASNPFHRLEHCISTNFRKADMWEVGGYLLVKHHIHQGLCDTLRDKMDQWEMAEQRNDMAEQQRWRSMFAGTTSHLVGGTMNTGLKSGEHCMRLDIAHSSEPHASDQGKSVNNKAYSWGEHPEIFAAHTDRTADGEYTYLFNIQKVYSYFLSSVD